MTVQFNVKDFGAMGDGRTTDTAAIQAAIDAAFAAGGGEVYIPSGTYIVSGNGRPAEGALMIKSNVFIKGDGMGDTVLKLADGSAQAVTGIIRSASGESTHDFGVSDLTIDGNRDQTTGKVDGWYNGFLPGKPGQDSNVTLSSVEIRDCSGYGFDPHERTANMLIENSVAHGNGLDGFVADYLIDSTFRNNLAYDNDRHGFNIVTTTHDMALLDNVSRDNGSAGIVVQRGSENITSPYHITISGGEVYGNKGEGVLVKMSNGVDISDIDIHHNGTSGVRVYGSSDVTVRDNLIHENAQKSAVPEVQILPFDDRGGSSGQIYPVDKIIVAGNTIAGSDKSTFGVAETNGQAGDTSVYDNAFAHLAQGTTSLQGAGDHVGSNVLLTNLEGGLGPDTISGSAKGDSINGMDGADTLNGAAGADVLWGGAGADRLLGGSGNDVLIGGSGADTLFGGAGADLFVFTSSTDSYRTATVGSADRIGDFDVRKDAIDLSGLGFTGLGDGHGSTLKLTTNAEHTRTYLKDLDPDLQGHRFELVLDGDFSGGIASSALIFVDRPALLSAMDETFATIDVVGVAPDQPAAGFA
jgi:Ca2+-binding RTX toxin-like protein